MQPIRWKWVLAFSVSVSMAWVAGAGAGADEGGHFDGEVIARWISNPSGPDREMEILETFRFIDARGKTWLVPAGTVVDGASIPRLFWNLVGPPFVGDYRAASVIHDRYCQVRSETWQATHRVFYDGLIASGYARSTAKILYAAVYGGGPRWSRGSGAQATGDPFVVVVPELSRADFDRLRVRIEMEDLSLSAIEAEVDRMLQP